MGVNEIINSLSSSQNDTEKVVTKECLVFGAKEGAADGSDVKTGPVFRAQGLVFLVKVNPGKEGVSPLLAPFDPRSCDPPPPHSALTRVPCYYLPTE